MNLISIPAFQDNYIWVLSEDNGRCLIVDPGEAAPFWPPSNKTAGSRKPSC
jgi:glyoxylase-like metal-dependent hydrolase (beta-lactamase superfamily II)